MQTTKLVLELVAIVAEVSALTHDAATRGEDKGAAERRTGAWRSIVQRVTSLDAEIRKENAAAAKGGN